MDYLPLFFQLSARPCLVVGGGKIAARKAGLLSRAGAEIHVVARSITQDLRQIAEHSGGTWREIDFDASQLQGKTMVIAATDDHVLNTTVSTLANDRQIPVNVVDSPELCSFILPAIVDRSPLMIAISSGGRSPVLARLLRSKIETAVPSAYGRLAKLVGTFRDEIKSRFSNFDERRVFWERILEGPIAEQVFSGNDSNAVQMMRDVLANATQPSAIGEVFLVGAGPGDPDLLTFKALRLMQKADVVLYDRLVADEIVDLTRRDAEKIYVGKRRAAHALPQQDINRLLVDLAKQGKTVVRLKGGDPYIFGRGGEEIEELSANRIPFQVVPGITAASGCSCYAGIPLTHRDYAQSVRFLTGHLQDGTIDLPWQELVVSNQTLVIYMGLTGLSTICSQLIAFGRSPSTPIALIQQGTTPNQKVIVSTLADIDAAVAAEEVKAPTLLIIGEVVNMREKLSWNER